MADKATITQLNILEDRLNLENDVVRNGEKYQVITFILSIIYIPLMLFSIIGLFVYQYGSDNLILNAIFSDEVMSFFYPTRVLVMK